MITVALNCWYFRSLWVPWIINIVALYDQYHQDLRIWWPWILLPGEHLNSRQARIMTCTLVEGPYVYPSRRNFSGSFNDNFQEHKDFHVLDAQEVAAIPSHTFPHKGHNVKLGRQNLWKFTSPYFTIFTYHHCCIIFTIFKYIHAILSNMMKNHCFSHSFWRSGK